MNLQEKINFYAGFFKSIAKKDKSIIILKDNAPEELRESVRKAHGDRFPDDYVYSWYSGILDDLEQYDCEKIEHIEDARAEIVNGLISVYTYDLTKWLNDDVYNVYYLSEALEEFDEKDGFKLLMMAQYKAIDEVFGAVVELLESDEVVQ
jgi:hypothetical protein